MDSGLTIVRKVPLSLTISIGAHLALIGGVVLAFEGDDEDRSKRELAARVATTIEVVPKQPETLIRVDVSFLSSEQLEALAGVVPDDAAPTAPRGAIASSTTARGTDRIGGTSTTPGTGSSSSEGSAPAKNRWLDMRKGKADKLRLDGALSRFDPSAGPGPEKVIRTGQLEQAGRELKSEQGPFTARVEKDGNVSLKDGKNFNIRFAMPGPKTVGRGITDWYYSDKGDDGKRGKRTLESEVGGSIDQGNEATNDPGDRSRAVIVPVFRGGFDVTDALMRKFGAGDPYASKKLAFLDSTRDERAQIGAKHRAEQLAQTDILVRKNLEQMWAHTTSLADRKRALFEMWDEAVETGDPKVVAAGDAARRQIVGFIRAKLALGSPNAYTAAELAACNRSKQSKQPFAPYD